MTPWRDVCWAAWRQNRAVLSVSAAVAVAFAGCLGLLAVQLSGLRCPADTGCLGHGTLFAGTGWLLYAATVLPLLAGVFWSAPLVAREYDQGTRVVAWGQDVPPGRWLRAHLAVFAAVAAGCGGVVYAAASRAATALAKASPQSFSASVFNRPAFEVLAPLPVAYAAAALGIGALVSVTLRRTLPAVAVTAAAVGVLWVALGVVRPHYLPPLRVYAPAAANAAEAVGKNPLYLHENVWADARGRVRAFPEDCGAGDFVACLRAHGITQRVSVYQPGSRESAFQLLEAGLCLLVGGAAAAAAHGLVGRRR